MLKQLLAEKELELKVKDALLKKNPPAREEIREVVEEMRKYAPVTKLLQIAGIPKSSYYYQPAATAKRGKKPHRKIFYKEGYIVFEEEIVALIKELLSHDFTSNYGYIKVTHWLEPGLYYQQKACLSDNEGKWSYSSKKSPQE